MDSALKPTESPAAALVFESMQVPWVMPKHVVLTRVFKIHSHSSHCQVGGLRV